MAANVILQDAGVSLGGRPVLRGISVTLGPGEVLGVAGPNGSGKTTLLRLLATLVRLDQGAGRILGAPLGSPEAFSVRPDIGLIGHVPALIAELSLRENLEHATRLSGRGISGVGRALSAVGLDDAGDVPLGPDDPSITVWPLDDGGEDGCRCLGADMGVQKPF